MTKKRFTRDNTGCVLDNIRIVKAINVEQVVECLNALHEENQRLKEVIDSRDVEISELGKQRNYLVDENKALQLKIKMLEQVKPIRELPKSIDVVIRNE